MYTFEIKYVLFCSVLLNIAQIKPNFAESSHKDTYDVFLYSYLGVVGFIFAYKHHWNYVVVFLKLTHSCLRFVQGTYIVATRFDMVLHDDTMCMTVYSLLKAGVCMEWTFMICAIVLPFCVYGLLYKCGKRSFPSVSQEPSPSNDKQPSESPGSTFEFYWLIQLTYSTDLFYWFILLTYSTDLFNWLILLIYSTDLFYCFILLTYSTDLFYWLIQLTFLTDLFY